MNRPLSKEDEDLLRWSGEMDGSPEAETAAELDALSASVSKLPAPEVSPSVLADAIGRDLEARRGAYVAGFVKWRKWAFAAAAAALIIATSVLLFSWFSRQGGAPEEVVGPGPRPESTVKPVSPLASPKPENMRRIRGVRERIARLRDLDRPAFSKIRHRVSPSTGEVGDEGGRSHISFRTPEIGAAVGRSFNPQPQTI